MWFKGKSYWTFPAANFSCRKTSLRLNWEKYVWSWQEQKHLAGSVCACVHVWEREGGERIFSRKGGLRERNFSSPLYNEWCMWGVVNMSVSGSLPLRVKVSRKQGITFKPQQQQELEAAVQFVVYPWLCGIFPPPNTCKLIVFSPYSSPVLLFLLCLAHWD